MNAQTSKTQSISGWNFDNSFGRLPEHFYTKLDPIKVKQPHLLLLNEPLAESLGLNFDTSLTSALAALFSGNSVPEGAEPLAQAYAGHQFGHFTILGDGRAHLLGEHITPDNKRVDIQFKGSGKTPYARGGDGRAALGPMLREYIISEAMAALAIPTTRSLAVVTTGEPVFRETILQGAILTRVAASHIRIGSFEYLASQNDNDGLKKLADYVIDRHYPELKVSSQPYRDLLKTVMDKHIALVNEWLRVGFIHGVMNTDNMAISGETIDYGPCAFMDRYDPNTVFSSIDRQCRYAYANQPHMAQWNLARLAEALLPLLASTMDEAVPIAEEIIDSFYADFHQAWLAMMRNKLGLFGNHPEDEPLIGNFLKWMQRNKADYTNSFRDISTADFPQEEKYQADEFKAWHQEWQQCLERNEQPLESAIALMQANNPSVIPRNHLVEAALNAAEQQSDLSVFEELLTVISKPYVSQPKESKFTRPPDPEERVYQTFCGT